MVSFRRSPGREHVLMLCLNVSSLGSLLDHSCSTVLLPSLLALFCEYVSHHIRYSLAAAPPHTFALHISLNSLDHEGVRLLSPRDSQIISKTSLQVPMISYRWRNRAQGGARWSSCSLCRSVIQLICSGAQLGRSGICSIRGSLLLFWFRSRTLIVFGWCNAIFMYCVKWPL